VARSTLGRRKEGFGHGGLTGEGGRGRSGAARAGAPAWCTCSDRVASWAGISGRSGVLLLLSFTDVDTGVRWSSMSRSRARPRRGRGIVTTLEKCAADGCRNGGVAVGWRSLIVQRGGGGLDDVAASAGKGGRGAVLSVRIGTCPRGRGRRLLGARLWRVGADPAKTGPKASSRGQRRADVADGGAVVAVRLAARIRRGELGGRGAPRWSRLGSSDSA
jgi:hypothetical protein